MEDKPYSDDSSLISKEPGSSTVPRNARWTYNTESDPLISLVPEFVMFGSDEIRKALPLFEHEHPGCYEFVLIERGKASWELNDVIYETQAGDLFYSRPGEKHRGGFNVIEPCKFWWIIIAVPHHQGWLRLSPEESKLIEQALAKLPRVVHIGLNPVESFKKLKKALMNESPLQSMAVRHALLDLLLAFIQPGAGTSAVADDLLRQFDMLIDKMGKEPEWRPSVEKLAAFAGVSASHFYRTFQEYTGEPPITFVERLRVKEACRQLTESQDSVTDITHRLGYQSSQHFATVFKRFVGVTPTEWRKARSGSGMQTGQA
ncbi:AraC family transcriptional regulator [Paenibacillus alkaliterrae]|uniref:helix-turn-helix domain-containing protein n=1 Tax=Paenibacillus alkaliterrae TaxID=320909 RepID=UPI001F283AD6|nr:AraC family transcriptional regulator [Paenibacillus alkaliterrae]MCF2937720.1 AraC family transcriptional regulator [Paenibacillus alkaliterrae]